MTAARFARPTTTARGAGPCRPVSATRQRRKPPFAQISGPVNAIPPTRTTTASLDAIERWPRSPDRRSRRRLDDDLDHHSFYTGPLRWLPVADAGDRSRSRPLSGIVGRSVRAWRVRADVGSADCQCPRDPTPMSRPSGLRTVCPACAGSTRVAVSSPVLRDGKSDGDRSACVRRPSSRAISPWSCATSSRQIASPSPLPSITGMLVAGQAEEGLEHPVEGLGGNAWP